MTASNAENGPGRPAASAVAASGATASPWLKILAACSAASAVLLLLTALAGWLVAGPAAAASALFGGAVVILFFAVSLLIGHVMGRRNPSGAIGVFILTYLVKVVGFAAVLFAFGRPEWLDGAWFLGAAVATVVVWQAAEVFAFSRTRHLLYSESGQEVS